MPKLHSCGAWLKANPILLSNQYQFLWRYNTWELLILYFCKREKCLQQTVWSACEAGVMLLEALPSWSCSSGSRCKEIPECGLHTFIDSSSFLLFCTWTNMKHCPYCLAEQLTGCKRKFTCLHSSFFVPFPQDASFKHRLSSLFDAVLFDMNSTLSPCLPMCLQNTVCEKNTVAASYWLLYIFVIKWFERVSRWTPADCFQPSNVPHSQAPLKHFLLSFSSAVRNADWLSVHPECFSVLL